MIVTNNSKKLKSVGRELSPYVLIVDDDEDDIEILSTALGVSIRVKKMSSPMDAIYFLTAERETDLPRLIISDYNMPGFNGGQFLTMLKSRAHLRDIPVVIYSTIIPDINRDILMKAGDLACIIKPDSETELQKHVTSFKELLGSIDNNGSIIFG